MNATNLLNRVVVVWLVVLGCRGVEAGTTAFTNSSTITINDTSAPTKATPYPSVINVAGMTGVIQKVTVQLTGLTHTFPDDIDILLVAPDGSQALVMSDAGGSNDVNGVNLLLDDAAPNSLPDSTPLASGTFKPTNHVAGDTFPAPAPAASGVSALSAFQGSGANGNWNLYVMDDSNGDSGSLAGWTLTITTLPSAQPGDLVISEFRVRGPNGANDEFVEIHNATDSDHTVSSVDASSGYAVAASNGVARFTIPNGTVIPARGHYLGVNSVGYSLASSPAGNGTTATGDATYTTDIPDNAGIALFRTSNGANFNLPNRLDAVGSTSEANTLYKEGTGYQALTPFSIDYAFYRNLISGVAKDTNNNAADFLFVDTNGTSAGAGQRLGAPGPENLSSPIHLTAGASLVRTLVDPGVAASSAPNRVRDFTSDPPNNSTFGTLTLLRKFTNRTGGNLARLRFRIVNLATFPSPFGIADLRPRTSTDVVVGLSGGGNTTVRGTTLEQPPSQLNGGGFNCAMSSGAVTLGSPLANNAAINVRFLFGIQQTGTYQLAVIPETLPGAAADVWILSGSTETTNQVETVTRPTIVSVEPSGANVNVDFTTDPGLLYQLQRTLNLTNATVWTDTGSAIAGTGAILQAVHAAGAGPLKQFYRIKVVP